MKRTRNVCFRVRVQKCLEAVVILNAQNIHTGIAVGSLQIAAATIFRFCCGEIERRVLHKDMGVTKIQRTALANFPIGAEGNPGAILIGNARRAILIRHRALVVGEAGAQSPFFRRFIAAAHGDAEAVLPFFCGQYICRAVA